MLLPRFLFLRRVAGPAGWRPESLTCRWLHARQPLLLLLLRLLPSGIPPIRQGRLLRGGIGGLRLRLLLLMLLLLLLLLQLLMLLLLLLLLLEGVGGSQAAGGGVNMLLPCCKRVP